MLTIAYIKGREDSKEDWFLDSLGNQLHEAGSLIDRVVIIDRCCDMVSRRTWNGTMLVRTPPKPTVWQGKYRLASEDYFAPSNARNTAFCLAPDGWIAFVDDLSVLLPGWMEAVMDAMKGNYIALGAYKKVKKFHVEHGVVKSFEPFPDGVDSRLPRYPPGKPTDAPGSDLYGCSFALPIEAALNVNGFDEDCDSMGGEDTGFGIMLHQRGWKFKYDPRMMTYESEEHHNVLGEKPLKRIIKPSMKGSKDASWDMLNAINGGRNWAPNYFGSGGLRELRKRILAGEPFPTAQIPEHHWVDGQPIREM